MMDFSDNQFNPEDMEDLPFDISFYEYTFGNKTDFSNITFPNIDFRGNGSMRIDRLIAIILCIVAIIANAVSLFAIMQFKGTFTANKQLVTSLLMSDLFISLCFLTASLTNNNNFMFPVEGEDEGKSICIYAVVEALMISGQLTNLLNLAAMALDHYIAINIPLKHSYLMDRRHVGILIAGVWVLGSLCGFSDFLLPFTPLYKNCRNQKFLNYCDTIKCTMFEPNFVLFAVVILCLFEMVFLYSQVFITIYRYPQLQTRHAPNIRRNNKGLVTTIIILLSYIICWLPYCLMELTMTIVSATNLPDMMNYYQISQQAQYYLYNLIALNSIFDPLIYAIRMPDMQNSYRRLLRMCKCKKRKPGMHHISMMDRKSTTSGTVIVDNATETGV
ncbi:melanocortin receptor 4-like [Octopus vulgaris]|uniref:Melanocortin receptor 4-like n=3 Tax=Octopus TaxID=6643 RepID=A0AA36B893_OCTVU|nr:melanocortin receptor 4-like [Octopus vulgaris]